MHALTPTYHFSIVACPPVVGGHDQSNAGEILYRGSVPTTRNFPFLRRLRLRTIVCLQKKAVGGDEPLSRWAQKHNVDIVWIKVDKMTEESLGMSRSQVSDVLKVCPAPPAFTPTIRD
jgi:hypothetical protein